VEHRGEMLSIRGCVQDAPGPIFCPELVMLTEEFGCFPSSYRRYV
jgi:hypothetical protein